MNLLQESVEFLHAIGPMGWVLLCLPLVFFELPRYTLLYFISGVFSKPQRKVNETFLPEYSVIVTGHNESRKFRNVVIALHEQSHPPKEILVMSDGSTDDSRREIDRLFAQGKIQAAHHVELRGGKSAGLNLISGFAKTDFVVQVDCDTSFDRHAMRCLLSPFRDPEVGVVSGNILPRNDRDNLLTSFQAIEYLVSLSLGRQASDLIDQVSIASGAFSGFRRAALEDGMGFDAGSGEDLDITLKLRQRGWKARFVANAIAYTDVPTRLSILTRQRLRWERDAFAIRYLKYNSNFSPFDRRFEPLEAVHQFEFIAFNIISAAITPFYFLFVWAWMGEGTLVVMLASYLLLIAHDFIVFLLAVFANPRVNYLRHIFILPLYSLYYIIYMRSLRLYAYFDELTFRTSLSTEFVPQKVLNYLQDRK